MRMGYRLLRKMLSTGLPFILLASGFAQAVSGQAPNIAANNTLLQKQWVNWYPAKCASHDAVAELAELLANNYSRRDLPRAAHDWICDNIFYDWDAFHEGTYSALRADDVLKEQKAVCEGVSNLTQELLLALNVPCIKVWGAAISSEDSWDDTELDSDRVNHTWNEYFMDGQWHCVDCTMDMNNRFEDGAYISIEKEHTFFDPDNRFFSMTHKILYRGDDAPNNVPSEWAKTELSLAVECRGFELRCFTDYQAPILKSEFYALLGGDSGETTTITRAEAAESVCRYLSADKSEGNVFSDLTDCSAETIAAINTLFKFGIMRGTSEGTFSPNRCLTRQEAIIVAARLIGRGG